MTVVYTSMKYIDVFHTIILVHKNLKFNNFDLYLQELEETFFFDRSLNKLTCIFSETVLLLKTISW